MKTNERIKFRFSLNFLFCFISIGASYAAEVNLSEQGNSTAAVKVVVEVQGKLNVDQHVDASSSKNSTEKLLPLQGIAELTYDERILREESTRSSQRFYHEANAKIEVAKRGDERSLRSDLRAIGCQVDGTKPLLYSPKGALERNELELITVPFNSLFVDQLLPKKNAKKGSEWEHSNELLAKLLNLDAVTAGSVKSRVVAVEKDLVRIAISGSLVGSVDGVVTDLEVEGKYNFHRENKRIVWLAAKLNETRAVGSVTPGFEVVARVRMVIENRRIPTGQFAAFSSVQNHHNASLLEHRARSERYSFLHDRRWHLINETPHGAILRMVDDGETIAQCNCRELQVDPKKPTSLDHFKTEILKSLKQASPQIVDAAKISNQASLQIMRVQVMGSVSNNPVQWIYYHATNDEGLGLSYSFTMAADAAEKFHTADHDITNSLRIANKSEQTAVRSTVTR